jgi:hypothetical protein
MSDIGQYLCDAAQGKLSHADWFNRVDMSTGTAYQYLMDGCLRILIRKHNQSCLTPFDCGLIFHVEHAFQQLNWLRDKTTRQLSAIKEVMG